MPFNPVSRMIGFDAPDPIGIDQLKRRNALAEREMSLAENTFASNQAHREQVTQNAFVQAEQERKGEWIKSAVGHARQNPAMARQIIASGKAQGFIEPNFPDELSPEQIEQVAAHYGVEAAPQALPFDKTPEGQKLSAQHANALEVERIRATNARALEEQKNRNSTSEGGRAPSGYRWKKDGSMEAIPGGPADIKATDAAEKERMRASHAAAAAANVIQTVDSAIELVGRGTVGFGSQKAKDVGYEKAIDLESALETIKANLGFDRIQQMREASPTGGALGQVAVQELTALQSTVASLNQRQSPDRLKANLQKIRGHYEKWQNVMRQAAGEPAAPQQKRVIRTGTSNGRKVVKYEDGSIAYAD